ncbi:MAG: hypothetical protein IJE97_17340 [Thermoguttaceae bacterium]|nr:hypothetical protein [Thermoguttaceae bacterium]
MRGIGKRRAGVWGGTAALCGVFLSGTVGDIFAAKVKIEELGKREEIEKKETGERTNAWLEKSAKILTIPAAETRSSVRELRPGDILAAKVKIEKKKERGRNEKKETGERTNAWLEKSAKILTIPAAETRSSVRELRPGDILAARWEDEERNGTPGFWNHLAIVGADGTCVVEAQKSADGVVTASINDFLARYSEIVVFRFFDAKTARQAASFAEKRVAVVAVETILSPSWPSSSKRGEEKREVGEVWAKKGGEQRGPRYSWSASLAPMLRNDATAENCVSLVRRAFWEATGVDYRWKTPDDLARWDKSGDFAKIGRF